VELCIAESLQRALNSAIDLTGVSDILLVGGVAANQFIRSHIAEGLWRSRAATIRWPEPGFSGDNAVGAAWWALTHKAV
jgi:N6-L-threonylcarbamoyladenine synthase